MIWLYREVHACLEVGGVGLEPRSRWRPRTPGWQRSPRRWPSPHQARSPGFTQGVKLRVFFKDHQDTGCEDDSGALPDAKAVQASSVLVQLRSLKFTCFGTNLHQSSLTRKWSFWDLGRTPEAAHTSALSSMTSASNKQKRSRSCKSYFYGEISKIRSMKCSRRRASPGCGWCHPPQSPWQALLQIEHTSVFFEGNFWNERFHLICQFCVFVFLELKISISISDVNCIFRFCGIWL